MKYVFCDGGRASAGYRGKTGDCVVRAISIAAQRPYTEIYKALAEGNAKSSSARCKSSGVKSVRNGVDTKSKWFKDYMNSIGFLWVPTMSIGSGCRIHLADGELPPGRIIVSLSRHYAAVIDGVLHDTYDCSRDGSRCVYGYWTLG